MAAGLGFKTFTTGEVLTAADTNGYLMQGVLVFASAAARDAAITSPQEGQCCYLKDTDAVLTYSGAAWVGFDDSNAIQNTIVDAKGDIVAASGSDTPARLAVGANGTVLTADSTQATGLAYTTAATRYPWTTWSPTLAGITKGNGTEIARYVKIGKTVIFNYSFTLGSTSAVTGNLSITLPSTAANGAYNVTSWVEDSGVAAYPYFCAPNTTSVLVFGIITTGTYASAFNTSSTVPFTWGTNDNIRIAGQYEEA